MSSVISLESNQRESVLRVHCCRAEEHLGFSTLQDLVESHQTESLKKVPTP